jgi:transcriptional regulator with XRE-family HTH domain
MPKVYLSEQDKLNNRLTSWIYGEMKNQGMSQTELAKERGISQQLLSYRLKNKLISFEDLIFFIKTFQPEDDDLLRLLGR